MKTTFSRHPVSRRCSAARVEAARSAERDGTQTHYNLTGRHRGNSDEPFNRFSDLSALDAVDPNFGFVFHVALGRRLSAAPRPAVKSAFYVGTPAGTHYVKLHGMLTDYAAARGLVHRSRPRGQVARRSAPGVVEISRGKSCLQT